MTVLFFISIVLITGTLTAAQENHIRNFHVASQNNTHITFSWDIVDGYHDSSYIDYFSLYYLHRYGIYSPQVEIHYSSTTRVGVNFQYTSINNYLGSDDYNINREYIVWIRVNRPSLDPRYTYSARIYVNIASQSEIVLEFKVYLSSTQTCSDFTSNTQADIELNWIIYKTCQCTIPQDLLVQEGYFTCASDYVIYRTKVKTYSPSLDIMFLKANLTSFLTGQDSNARITINGQRYLIELGPCGLTVPDLDSPHCVNVEEPSSTAQASSITSIPQDNTAIIAVVASMCGAVLILVLSGFIIFIVMTVRKKNCRPTGTAKVKTAHDQGMSTEKHTSNIPKGCRDDYAYAGADVATQSN